MELSLIISTSIDDMNGEMKGQVTYTPSLGYIGVDECVYEACVAYTDEESGELYIDPQRCYEATIVIIVDECAPEVSTRGMLYTLMFKCFWDHTGCRRLYSFIKELTQNLPFCLCLS